MNADPINEAGLRLIMRNEGCRLRAYRDIVDVCTIGYGHTGGDVHDGLTWTQEQCDAALAADLDMFEQGVDDAIGDAETTDNEFAAMVSLAYNVGLGHFRTSSVAKLHAAGDHAGAADAFRMWNKAGGRLVPGLSRRREEERELYLKFERSRIVPSADKPRLIQWLKKELGL